MISNDDVDDPSNNSTICRRQRTARQDQSTATGETAPMPSAATDEDASFRPMLDMDMDMDMGIRRLQATHETKTPPTPLRMRLRSKLCLGGPVMQPLPTHALHRRMEP